MGSTIVEKILGSHAGKAVKPDEIVDIRIDARVARDFGGANVVQHLRKASLGVADPSQTFFTFDCNPTGSDQKYATNQQKCRDFAREKGLRVFDINQGIGTHLAIDRGLVLPGQTFVSTDSHANILGALCAFGQGMGDQDVAAAWAHGAVWFKVPRSVKIVFKGRPGPQATPKDVTLALLRKFGANGLLGVSAEMYGEYADSLDLSARITISSMFTEMGAIIGLFPVNTSVIEYVKKVSGKTVPAVVADADAKYDAVYELDLTGLEPLIARPGHPEDVVPVAEVAGTPIDSALIGSCTNGRIEDIRAGAELLAGRQVAPGVVFKVVPATDDIWVQAMQEGLVQQLKTGGAMIGSAGCAGCAEGQIGQNGPGETTLTTGNRNFSGKQGKGEVYLASPQTVAASAIAGVITTAADLRAGNIKKLPRKAPKVEAPKEAPATAPKAPSKIEGRVWVIPIDNIDTDMIFHNRHLAITARAEMAAFTFGNLAGYQNFATEAKPGDIVVVGKNFGAGSSRAQAVDCFLALGISAIVAESFGAIYERNAINSGLPIMIAPLLRSGVEQNEVAAIDFVTGKIKVVSRNLTVQGTPFSDVQLKIYQRGGLLVAETKA